MVAQHDAATVREMESPAWPWSEDTLNHREDAGVNLEPLKRTFAMFGVVIGALYIFTVLYSLFQHGIFSPFDLAVAAVVMYAVFVLDRRYIRPFFYPSFAREGEGRSEDPEDESSETLRERGSQTERSER
jgi:hypothetical protein